MKQEIKIVREMLSKCCYYNIYVYTNKEKLGLFCYACNKEVFETIDSKFFKKLNR